MKYMFILYRSGQGKSLPEIVDVATSHSSSAIDFLDKHGLVLGTVLQCGGHSVYKLYL